MKELFFYGLRVDCSEIKDFAGSAVCSALQEKEDILIREAELRYRYGFLAKVCICIILKRHFFAQLYFYIAARC